jgi:AcrR family transcriptional regulator
MSTQERKAKEKEELRTLILEGAMKLFVDKGIEHTTIRSIADSINYSIGTVYVYFKDKNDILYALHSLGFLKLREYFKELYEIQDPIERLTRMGVVYAKFALENTELYDLMFNLKAPIECLRAKDEAEWDEGKAAYDVLRNTVKDCMDAGRFKGHLLEPLSFLIWSMAHGMCSLEIGKRTQGVGLERPETIIEDAYAEFVKILDKI